MGKIIRFIVSFALAAIAFLIGTGIAAAFAATTLVAFIIPVVLALIVFSVSQFFLGIFKIKNLIFFAIIAFIINAFGISIF